MEKTNITGIKNKQAYENKRFGLLTVVEYINSREVICKCACGNTIVTRKYKLDNGSVTSCGCDSEYSFNKIKYEQIANDEFTVKTYINACNILCICSCGKEFITTKQHIDNDEVHSCGCRHHVIDYNKKYKLNKKGYLKIVKHIGYGYYECECECGNICYKRSSELDAVDNPSCGCKAHEKRGQTADNIIIQSSILDYLAEYPKSTIQDIAKDLCDYILSINGDKVECNTRNIISPSELDVYLPERSIAVEFNGNYWHSELYKDKYYHINKTIDCMQKGIRLIHIFEYEWLEENNKERLKKYLSSILGSNKTTIYARNTVVKEIDNDAYINFTKINHLQGEANASVRLGLFSKNELLGVMSFGSPRFNGNYQYELIRLCWKESTSVVGGAEKLFKYFITRYNPKSIITYCDLSKFTGDVYKRLGFSELGITEPNYVWVSRDNKDVLSRYMTQKKKLVELGFGYMDQTENDIMHNLGYHKVYDCGNAKYEWKSEV